MKNKIFNGIILSIITLSFLMIGSQIEASSSNGTIDDTYRYAWGENVGWVDFGSTTGDVHITDDVLSGYAYGENIGWINLGTVTNDKEGHLAGYAWGENVGFIDFSQVSIDNHGYFLGQAYGENIGWILFNKDDTNNVMTDWRPKSSRSRGSSGSGSMPQIETLPVVETPITEIPTTPTITPTPPTTCPSPLLTRTLKLTSPIMKGDDIKQLQTYLNCHQYSNLTTDGIFGKLTKQAVILFQKANELKGDGIVGPLTRAKLK